jgi:hypothetical protein
LGGENNIRPQLLVIPNRFSGEESAFPRGRKRRRRKHGPYQGYWGAPYQGTASAVPIVSNKDAGFSPEGFTRANAQSSGATWIPTRQIDVMSV